MQFKCYISIWSWVFNEIVPFISMSAAKDMWSPLVLRKWHLMFILQTESQKITANWACKTTDICLNCLQSTSVHFLLYHYLLWSEWNCCFLEHRRISTDMVFYTDYSVDLSTSAWTLDNTISLMYVVINHQWCRWHLNTVPQSLWWFSAFWGVVLNTKYMSTI